LIIRIIAQGKIPFLEIETNGATQVIDYYKKHKKVDEIVSIFLMPPSFSELEKRIIRRNTEPEEVIKKRLAKAKQEVGQANLFQYIVISDTVPQTVAEIEKIIKNEFSDLLNQKEEQNEGRKA